MTATQKRRRAELERSLGRPDPKSIEKEMAEALNLLPGRHPIDLRTDEHAARDLKRVNRELQSIHNELSASREALMDDS